MESIASHFRPDHLETASQEQTSRKFVNIRSLTTIESVIDLFSVFAVHESVRTPVENEIIFQLFIISINILYCPKNFYWPESPKLH